MKNLFLAADKFEGRLNMGIFTNIEKSITESDFNATYPSDKFAVLAKSQIDEFIRNVHEEVGGDIKKGGFNDNKEVRSYIEKAEAQLSSLKPVNVLVKGGVEKVYVLPLEDESFKKGNEDELNKGYISESFDGYGDNKITFIKTGAEIKTKLINSKAGIDAEIESVNTEITSLMTKLVRVPTQTRKGYGFSESVECPYKVFPWELTYSSGSRMAEYGEESSDCCDSEEEAKINVLYNDAVYRWMELSGEKKAIELYERNLSDKKNYDLTARQMIALGY